MKRLSVMRTKRKKKCQHSGGGRVIKPTGGGGETGAAGSVARLVPSIRTELSGRKGGHPVKILVFFGCRSTLGATETYKKGVELAECTIRNQVDGGIGSWGRKLYPNQMRKGELFY